MIFEHVYQGEGHRGNDIFMTIKGHFLIFDSLKPPHHLLTPPYFSSLPPHHPLSSLLHPLTPPELLLPFPIALLALSNQSHLTLPIILYHLTIAL